jgi:Zn-dependent oligopeptidase
MYFRVLCLPYVDGDATSEPCYKVLRKYANLFPFLFQFQARLTHGELETLLHEFGHALHSLLSRTRYQHLSGTRAAADFVETPSQLMEHFAWSPAYLEAAGTPLPQGLLASLARGQKKHAALDGLQQVFFFWFALSFMLESVCMRRVNDFFQAGEHKARWEMYQKTAQGN